MILGSSDPDLGGQVAEVYPVTELRIVSLDGPVGGGFFGIASEPQVGNVLVSIRAGEEVEVGRFGVIHGEDQRASPRYLSNAYAARVCVSPSHHRMVVVYIYAGRIDLYRLNDFAVDSVQVPYPYRPHITFSERAGEQAFFGSSDSTRTGYSDCAVTPQRVYALYQGVLSVEEREQGTKYTELHSFNWDGELMRIAILDHYTTTMAVTEDDSLLYTTRGSPSGPEIRVTQLRRSNR